MRSVLRVTRPGCHPQECGKGCYWGEAIRCRCVCHGINHGVGFNQAIENTRECLEWFRELLHGRRCGERVEISAVEIQPWLFE